MDQGFLMLGDNMPNRKQLIKLARRIPEQELLAFLTGNGVTLDDWSYEHGAFYCRPPNGKETFTMISDDVLAFALEQLIARHKASKPS